MSRFAIFINTRISIVFEFATKVCQKLNVGSNLARFSDDTIISRINKRILHVRINVNRCIVANSTRRIVGICEDVGKYAVTASEIMLRFHSRLSQTFLKSEND